MGLFSKGKKKNIKQSKDVETLTMADQIVFEKLTSDQDEYLIGIAKKLLDGKPLILNFEPLDIDQANKVISFFSGVVFAISGEIVHVQEKVFMFASKHVYEDGSMDEFLREIVE
jgi:cell division inhibitor SepF